MPYPFSGDRRQFRAAADWFEHRAMPDAVLFRGEDIDMTLSDAGSPRAFASMGGELQLAGWSLSTPSCSIGRYRHRS